MRVSISEAYIIIENPTDGMANAVVSALYRIPADQVEVTDHREVEPEKSAELTYVPDWEKLMRSAYAEYCVLGEHIQDSKDFEAFRERVRQYLLHFLPERPLETPIYMPADVDAVIKSSFEVYNRSPLVQTGVSDWKAFYIACSAVAIATQSERIKINVNLHQAIRDGFETLYEKDILDDKHYDAFEGAVAQIIDKALALSVDIQKPDINPDARLEKQISDAYAAYDSDPAVNGPDDYGVFRKACLLLLKNLFAEDIFTHDSTIGAEEEASHSGSLQRGLERIHAMVSTAPFVDWHQTYKLLEQYLRPAGIPLQEWLDMPAGQQASYVEMNQAIKEEVHGAVVASEEQAKESDKAEADRIRDHFKRTEGETSTRMFLRFGEGHQVAAEMAGIPSEVPETPQNAKEEALEPIADVPVGEPIEDVPEAMPELEEVEEPTVCPSCHGRNGNHYKACKRKK